MFELDGAPFELAAHGVPDLESLAYELVEDIGITDFATHIVVERSPIGERNEQALAQWQRPRIDRSTSAGPDRGVSHGGSQQIYAPGLHVRVL